MFPNPATKAGKIRFSLGHWACKGSFCRFHILVHPRKCGASSNQQSPKSTEKRMQTLMHLQQLCESSFLSRLRMFLSKPQMRH
jgi:hypothetical protein